VFVLDSTESPTALYGGVMGVADMVAVPAGRFRMGHRGFYPEEEPVREVSLTGFLIDRGPVTVASFARFVEETGYVTLAERAPDRGAYPDADPDLLLPGSAVFHPTPGPVPLNEPHRWWAYVPGADWRHPWGRESDNSERAEHPVTHVAFADALAYAEWAGQSLPTEDEWEYAARGGLDGAVFAWGDEQYPCGELMANFWQGDFPWRNTGARGWRGTSPVGLFEPNGFELYDMTGNVWEWTSDEYPQPCADALPAGNSCCAPRMSGYDLGRRGAGIPSHVIKGGSHLCAASYCFRYRPAARQPGALDTSTSHIGFRCVVRDGT
jgi:formylglycine-generating enzyme